METILFILPWFVALAASVGIVMQLRSQDQLVNANYYIQNLIRIIFGVTSGILLIYLFNTVYLDPAHVGRNGRSSGFDFDGLLAFFAISVFIYFLGCLIWYGRLARYFRLFGFIFALPVIAMSSLLMALPIIVFFALPFDVIDKRCPLKMPDPS